MPSLPFGYQCLKRMWDDNAGLLHEYDDLLQHTDDESTRKMLWRACESFTKNLDTLERARRRHPKYKALPFEGEDEREFPDEGYGGWDEDQDDFRKEPSPNDALSGMSSPRMRAQAKRGDEEQNRENWLIDVEGLRGSDSPRMNSERAWKAQQETADFQKALYKAAELLGDLGEDNDDTALGFAPGDEQNDLPAHPLQGGGLKKHKCFSRTKQHLCKSVANELHAAAADLKDPQVVHPVLDAVQFLGDLAGSRERRDGDDPLTASEMKESRKHEKSLRSILDGKKGKWPTQTFMENAKRKALTEVVQQADYSAKSLDSIVEACKSTKESLTKSIQVDNEADWDKALRNLDKVSKEDAEMTRGIEETFGHYKFLERV